MSNFLAPVYVRRTFFSPFFHRSTCEKSFCPCSKNKHGNMKNETGTETERKISVVRSLIYRKRGLFCDPYHIYIYIPANTSRHRIYVRTHVRPLSRSRTVLANARKRTRTQINARKLIVAIDAWAISACKRDCDLRVRSKTFRMYYIYMYIYMSAMKCINKEVCVLDITISSAFPALKTTFLTMISTNNNYAKYEQ